MYPFMTLDDNTEIVHSEMKEDGRFSPCHMLAAWI